MRVRVRVATEGDLGAIVAMERVTPEAPHWSVEVYRAALAREDGSGERVRRVLVAEGEGSEVVGFVVGQVLRLASGEAEGEVESVAVMAEARRRGVGGAMCRELLGWFRAEGVREVGLEVRAGSVGAIALYEALGFVRGGVRRGYYADPVEDAVLMRLEVGGV